MIFWHKWFNPHCEHCREEAQENKVCVSCETLRTELAAVRYQNEQLMKNILEMVHPAPTEKGEQPQIEFKPLVNTWRVRKQMLEENDRQTARAMREAKAQNYESSKSAQQLEKELLGEDDAVRSSNA